MKQGRNHVRVSLFAVCVLVTLSLFALGGAAHGAETVKIGIIGPLQEKPGKAMKQAAIMAAEEINAQGGILGHEVELAFADEAFSPEKGITALKKLATRDRVKVVIGGYSSGITLASQDYLPRYKMIYLGVAAASPAITERIAEDYDKYKYTFRVGNLNAKWLALDTGQFIVNFFGKKLGVEKVAILAEKAKWTEGLVPFLEGFYRKNGMEVVYSEFMDVKTSDFSPIFSKVKSSGAELIVEVTSHIPETFIKQYHDQRVPVPIAGINVASQSSDFYEKTGGRCVGEIISNLVFRSPITPKTVPFWDDYVERWGTDPIIGSFGTYDAMYIYKLAAEKAGTFDAEKVVPALEKTDYVGTNGRIAFEEDHDLKFGVDYVTPSWAQWREGGERVIVFPEKYAEGKPVFPDWIELPEK
jgi:branched-chain amino acid transport system substrate-binding protein